MDGNQVRFEYSGTIFIFRFQDSINLLQYLKLIAHFQEKRSAHLVVLGPIFHMIVKFQEMAKFEEMANFHVGMICQFPRMDRNQVRLKDSGTTFI